MAKQTIRHAPRDGSTVFVVNRSTIARARWVGGDKGMWAYDVPDITHQIDFEPTHFVDDPAEFLP